MNNNKEVDKPKNEKKKSKKKIIKFSLLAFLLIVITIGTYIGYTEYYLPSKTNYNVEVYGENKLLYNDLTFKKDSYINVLNNNDEITEVIELETDSNKITLKNANSIDNLLFEKWDFEKKIDEKDEFYKRDIVYYNAKPVYVDKEDFVLTFTVDEKSTLVADEQEVIFLKSPYKKDTNISDYFPEVLVEEDFKGEWYIADNEINDDTEITEDSEVEFRTYQDKNDNEIDDFTETFDIDFVTNIKEEVDSVTVDWEETIKLPTLKDDTKVFYEWYEDEKFNVEFTEETKVRNNLTLYAKIKSFEDIVNESVNDPIDRKDIALQVEDMIEERNKPVDEEFKREIKEKEKEREELKKYNEENNVVSQNIEWEINLHNKNHNKLHLVTFLNPSNEFIYSVVAPYGQTIKVVDENGKLNKEYAVRNKTTIILDDNKLVTNKSNLEKYHSEYREINNTVFIKIQPIVKED